MIRFFYTRIILQFSQKSPKFYAKLTFLLINNNAYKNDLEYIIIIVDSLQQSLILKSLNIDELKKSLLSLSSFFYK